MTRMPAIAVLALFASASAGCATAQSPPAQGAAATDQAATSAGQLASTLAAAETANAEGDARKLARLLARIDALGAQPLDDASSQLVGAWRNTAPGTRAPMRGPALGPGFRSGMLAPGKRAALEQTFLSGRKATIAVAASGGEGVALDVTGRADKTVCSKRGTRTECRWIPTFTERHRIIVSNPNGKPVRYYLVIE